MARIKSMGKPQLHSKLSIADEGIIVDESKIDERIIQRQTMLSKLSVQ